MLKDYFDRNSSPTSVNVVINVPRPNESVEEDVESETKESRLTKLENSQILENLDQKLLHLCTTEREQLKELINEYKHLFPNIPRTNEIFCDVDIGNAIPVKQYPYRMNSFKKEYLQKEIQYILQNDFIEPSNNSWSAPCVLVPKPDKTF